MSLTTLIRDIFDYVFDKLNDLTILYTLFRNAFFIPYFPETFFYLETGLVNLLFLICLHVERIVLYMLIYFSNNYLESKYAFIVMILLETFLDFLSIILLRNPFLFIRRIYSVNLFNFQFVPLKKQFINPCCFFI